MAKSDIAVQEPAGAVADYINTLPPIPDDPGSYYSEEETRDEPLGVNAEDETDPTLALAQQQERAEAEAIDRARDAKGRFTKEQQEAADAEAAKQTPDATSADTAADPMKAFLESLPDEQRQAYQFSQALQGSDNPIAFLADQAKTAGLTTQLLEALGVPQDVLQQLNDPAAALGIDPDYEPSAYEALIQPHIDKLARFPDAVGEIAKPMVLQSVAQEMNRITPYLDASNVELQVQRAEIDALKEMLGVTLPQVDRAEVMKVLQSDPKATYESARNQVIGDKFKTAVSDYRQAVKARPETVGNESEGVTPISDLPKDRSEFGLVDAKDIFRTMFGGR